MYSHQSITRLVALRARFTGESHQQASKMLAGRDLSDVLGVWTQHPVIRRCPITEDLDPEIMVACRSPRQLLLPDALDRDQQALEAAVLLGIRDALRAVSESVAADDDEDDDFPPDRVVHKVSPSPGLIVVDVHDHAVVRLLTALIPRDAHEEWNRGVPGLRMSRSGTDVTLRLFAPHGILSSAQVVIRRVRRRAWQEVCDFIDDRVSEVSADPRRDSALGVSRREMTDMEEHRHHLRTSFLGSSMLRRFGLLRDAYGVDTWVTGSDIVNVEIYRGPTIRSVFQDLHHPLVGFVGDRVGHDLIDESDLLPDSAYIRLVDKTDDQPGSALRPPKLALRRLSYVHSRR